MQNQRTRSVAFLYTNNKLPEREIKKAIPFTIILKRTKHLGIHLTEEVKGPFIENYKTSIKEIDDTNKWKDIPCSWIIRTWTSIFYIKNGIRINDGKRFLL